MIAMLISALAWGLHQQTASQRRLQVIAREQADAEAIAEIRFPGFDVSDDAVRASSLHFCGKADECTSEFLAARDKLMRAAALDRKQKAALKILTDNSEGGFTDWRFAKVLYDAHYHPTRVQPPLYGRATCRASLYGRSVSSTCYYYGP